MLQKMSNKRENIDELKELVNSLSESSDSDIILYNGVIQRPCDEEIIRETIARGEGRRKNAILVLVTPGGDPDAAYRIARCLQGKYAKFTVYVSGICKSAGTLIAVGAHELIISDHGELGPLDIQMAKKDEFFASQSGLTVSTALEALETRAFRAIERMFLEIENNTGGMLSVQTATDLASKTVVGMYAPIAGQIDPMHIGEAARALLIADAYGQRLNRHSQNLASAETMSELFTQYPSHGFVIDREEAERLFIRVREPSPEEARLAVALGPWGRRPLESDPKKTVRFLNDPKPAELSHANDQNGETDGKGEQTASQQAAEPDPPAVGGHEALA